MFPCSGDRLETNPPWAQLPSGRTQESARVYFEESTLSANLMDRDACPHRGSALEIDCVVEKANQNQHRSLVIPTRAELHATPLLTDRIYLVPVAVSDGPDLWEAVNGSRALLTRWLPWIPFNTTRRFEPALRRGLYRRLGRRARRSFRAS